MPSLSRARNLNSANLAFPRRRLIGSSVNRGNSHPRSWYRGLRRFQCSFSKQSSSTALPPISQCFSSSERDTHAISLHNIHTDVYISSVTGWQPPGVWPWVRAADSHSDTASESDSLCFTSLFHYALYVILSIIHISAGPTFLTLAVLAALVTLLVVVAAYLLILRIS